MPFALPSTTAIRRSSTFSPRVAFASSMRACAVLPLARVEARNPARSDCFVAKRWFSNSSPTAWKRSPFATKSVSQFNSNITPVLPEDLATTRPFDVERPSRLVMPLRPFTRMISIALSKSPPDSSRAFLHSSMPAAVTSRRRFTSSAVYAT